MDKIFWHCSVSTLFVGLHLFAFICIAFLQSQLASPPPPLHLTGGGSTSAIQPAPGVTPLLDWCPDESCHSTSTRRNTATQPAPVIKPNKGCRKSFMLVSQQIEHNLNISIKHEHNYHAPNCNEQAQVSSGVSSTSAARSFAAPHVTHLSMLCHGVGKLKARQMGKKCKNAGKNPHP